MSHSIDTCACTLPVHGLLVLQFFIMAFLRASPMLRSLLVQSPRPHIIRAALPVHRQLYASQSYGGGEGDPRGEEPQKQGSNPATSDLEHPGPPPPSVGQGTGGGPTKAGSSSDGKDTQHHGGASSGGSSGKGSSSSTQSKSGASPAIHSENIPAEESAEVKKHNEELENRHDRASNKVNEDGQDNVSKSFWSGMITTAILLHGLANETRLGRGGADKNP